MTHWWLDAQGQVTGGHCIRYKLWCWCHQAALPCMPGTPSRKLLLGHGGHAERVTLLNANAQVRVLSLPSSTVKMPLL